LNKNKGLGRGLDALLGGNKAPPPVAAAPILEAGERLLTVKLAQLQPGKYQPRTQMDQASLAELAESIKEHGIMQPILVRSLGADKFEIIAGERRWRAAKLAGLNEVQVISRKVANDATLAMALIENIQREDLNPMEEAFGIQRLIEEFSMTHESAAKAVGRSRSAVTNLLRLTQLAKPVQDMVMQGKLDMGHARALLALSPGKQVALATEAIAKNWTVREIERQVMLEGKVKLAKPTKRADADLLKVEEEIADALGAHVTLKPKAKGAGSLVIEYGNLDQLDGIIEKLTGKKR
jgi:ParB family transcriptional regulator, chromosome partitioning protein